MKVIGLDPGLHGAFAVLDGATAWAKPMFLLSSGPKGRAEYDVEACLSFLHSELDLPNVQGCIVVLEHLQPMPAFGAHNFTFGYGFGFFEGMLAALGARIERVRPKVWQAAAGVTGKGKGRKDSACALCQRLFPQVNLVPDGSTKRHDGMADALLIAEYGRRVFGGTHS